MQTISAKELFAFTYSAYSQVTTLNVAAKIYDVTSGTPSLVTTVAMASIGAGVYYGKFQPVDGKDYLVITGVFTTTSYTTPDTTYAPSAECYHCGYPGSTHLLFNYGVYSQDAALDIAAELFDVTTGSGVMVDLVILDHVFMGVYFGDATGLQGDVYAAQKAVYTDNSYDFVDDGYAPASDAFQCFDAVSTNPGVGNVADGVTYKINGDPFTGTRDVVTNVFKGATLTGNRLTSRLRGST